ncbi:MAG: DUF4294 domain-containing protein [Alistipes sp.]|nr:DUF4294 domain-containing protein [Alistipes sp.]MBP3496327.1 DUF4294 domain-containing protein [Alistipes sp.]MBQ3208368.1 DUF4294 domain-containing protein [Alistipes sp.]MBQ6868988.1 DUF4294 domain-containing protein [Alistipes sp.]MBQ7951817.1 DUF4294 domain-containing protein [Alistipes sp.]
MAKRLYILLLLATFSLSAMCQSRRERPFWRQEWAVENGDSIAVIHITPVRKYARKPDMRRYARLVRAVKRVYPIAEEAKVLMATMEEELLALPNKKQQKLYIKGIEKRLIREYTPVLKKMTIYDGRVLLKLIDRQTDDTAFEIIKEFRGRVEAGLWQALAKMFGNNLKTDYNPAKDDQLLEQIVVLYEKGLL